MNNYKYIRLQVNIIKVANNIIIFSTEVLIMYLNNVYIIFYIYYIYLIINSKLNI